MATSLNVTGVPVTFKTLGGGLNTGAGVLGLTDAEASDLDNIDFDIFGSALKRNGYVTLNINPLSGTSQGIYFYSSLYDRKLVTVNSGKILKMDNLDGTWDDITGSVSFSTGGVDTATDLMLHFDGDAQDTTIVDSSDGAKTVTNTETHDSYTVLMLHCNLTTDAITFTDSSLGTHTCTAVGNAQVSTGYKKLGNGSLVLDSNGDYLSIPDSNDFYYAEKPFTIEFYGMHKDDLAVEGRYLYYHYDGPNDKSLLYFGSSGAVHFLAMDGGVAKANYTWNPTTVVNTWYHYALVRSSTDLFLFVNGVKQTASTIDTAISTNTLNNLTTSLYIGSNGTRFDGWIDEFRISKNIARFLTNFTPPTCQYGQVGIDTSMVKFGTGSGEFKGYERLSLADSDDWNFGATPFTIDFWAAFNNLTSTHNNYQMLYQQEVDNDNRVTLWLNSGTHLYFRVLSGSTTRADYCCSWSPLTNEWTHIAIVRTGTALRMYINGIHAATTSNTPIAANAIPDLAAPVYIGGDVVNKRYFLNGWLDEFRISKGIARWAGNFTPPSVAYNDQVGGFNHQEFDTFLGYVLGADKDNTPWQWNMNQSTATTMTVVTGLTGAKFIKKFQNYCFMLNVTVAGIKYPSRFYWATIKTIDTWDSADFIEVAYNDGDEISGVKELGDRLVIYKNNSIHVVIFTGDSDLPFIVQKSNSPVGCVAPYSIQATENGHIFVSYDGIYFFDGYNSYKVSDRINRTWNGINKEQLGEAVSLYQRTKNLYVLSLASNTSLYNNMCLTWNSSLNAWSKYSGMSVSAMTTILNNGVEERPYFGDYSGYVYRMDYGLNDSPLNTTTAISAFYSSNWKYYDTICDKKGVPHIYITHRNESATVLTLNYAYDFFNGNQHTQSFSCYTSQSVTSLTTRRDLDGQGRFVILKLSNNQTDTSFCIDGIGTYVTKESGS